MYVTKLGFALARARANWRDASESLASAKRFGEGVEEAEAHYLRMLNHLHIAQTQFAKQNHARNCRGLERFIATAKHLPTYEQILADIRRVAR